MSHVASTASAPNAIPASVVIPSGASVGDIAVIQFGGSTAYTPTLPSGWTTLLSGDVGNLRWYVLIKQLVSGEPGSTVTVNFAAQEKRFISATVISSASVTPDVTPTFIGADTAATSRATPSATLGGARQVLSGVIGRGNSSPTTWTAPAGFTRQAQAFGVATGGVDGAVAYASAGAGAIGGGNWVADIADLRAVTWMIIFAAGSTPLATPVVTAAATNPSTPGGTDGSISVSWAAITNATTYIVEHAPGAGATTGFVVDSAAVTGTSRAITGLSAGTYTVGVTAVP